MNLKPAKLAPVFIAAGVTVVFCFLRLLDLRFLNHEEWTTYDMRVRLAARFPAPVPTNFGCVFIGDEDIREINHGFLGSRFGLYWPRHIYGRAYRELAAEGVVAAGFDVLFLESRPDQGPVSVSLTQWPGVTNFLETIHPREDPVIFQQEGEKFASMESDDFLAWQMKRGGTFILAADRNVLPLPLYETNALVLGDIGADKDADGVLRRAKPFRIYRRWHPAFLQVANDPDYGVDLSTARVEPGKIILREGPDPIVVKIDAHTNFDLADFGGDKLPTGMARFAPAFTEERVWHMGIVLAARELKLDLEHADVDLSGGKITLRGPGAITRVIPVNPDGYFYINWELSALDPRILTERITGLLEQDQIRNGQRSGDTTNLWRGKLVVVGSDAKGNDLADQGTTPLEQNTCLVTKHVNIANSILTGRFVRKASAGLELALIGLLVAMTTVLTWRLRVLVASAWVALLFVAYVFLGAVLYVRYRFWLPLFLPITGGIVAQYGCMVTWRVVFEQQERRRVKSIFSRIVSPHVVQELLQKPLALGGERREVTVLFADVRGFTEFTDVSQEKAAAFVKENNLSPEAAEAYYNEHARETLHTVNTYLTLVADMVLKNEGVLDKYIGDCVMAFWGAPLPDSKQAMHCVQAAIDAQRAVYDLNRERATENRKRELENLARLAARQAPLPLLPILLLGTGVNTGRATAGLMGSQEKQVNYTVFGREVNLASRLESLSGRGRIFIGEATYRGLLRDNPALAATCAQLPADVVKLKGIRSAVAYEVPWRPPGALPFDEEFATGATPSGGSTTTFVRQGA